MGRGTSCSRYTIGSYTIEMICPLYIYSAVLKWAGAYSESRHHIGQGLSLSISLNYTALQTAISVFDRQNTLSTIVVYTYACRNPFSLDQRIPGLVTRMILTSDWAISFFYAYWVDVNKDCVFSCTFLYMYIKLKICLYNAHLHRVRRATKAQYVLGKINICLLNVWSSMILFILPQ